MNSDWLLAVLPAEICSGKPATQPVRSGSACFI
jgi:hypothetical protein